MTENVWLTTSDSIDVAPVSWGASAVRIDCTSCQARGPACSDCVVSVLLGVEDLSGQVASAHAAAPPRHAREHASETAPDPAADDPWLTSDEQAALAVLADSGLVPPLRLVAGS